MRIRRTGLVLMLVEVEVGVGVGVVVVDFCQMGGLVTGGTR